MIHNKYVTNDNRGKDFFFLCTLVSFSLSVNWNPRIVEKCAALGGIIVPVLFSNLKWQPITLN